MKSIALVATCLAVTAMAAKPYGTDQWNDTIKQQTTDFINVRKCMHGQAEADFVVYNKCIEPESQKWANTMADKKKMQHSGTSYQMKKCESVNGFGENISAGATAVSSSLKMWYTDEAPCYDPSTGSQLDTDECRNAVIGHMTAMIWKDASSYALGLAYSSDNTPYHVLHIGSRGNPVNSGDTKGNVGVIVKTQAECEDIVADYNLTAPLEVAAASDAVTIATTFAGILAAVIGAVMM